MTDSQSKTIEKEAESKNGGELPFVSKGMGSRIDQIAERIGGKRALAEKIGLSEAQLYRVISESSQPKIGIAAAIARAGGVSIDWLATGEDAVPPLSGTHQDTDKPSQQWRAPEGWLRADRVKAMIEVVDRNAGEKSPSEKARFVVELCMADPDRDKPPRKEDEK